MLGEIAFWEVFHCDIESLGTFEPSQELHKQQGMLKQPTVRQQSNPGQVINWPKIPREEGHKPLPIWPL